MTQPFRVDVVRSRKRRKTAQARLEGDVLKVMVPAAMAPAEVDEMVATFSERIRRKLTSDGVDLAERARVLARRHGLQEPTGIRWVSNQAHRWGSCTPATGEVRISDRIAGFPEWVLDYVIVHELAHFDIAGHGAAFDEIVDRYPLAERARGYLIAKSNGG